jgi:hypothetical protein
MDRTYNVEIKMKNEFKEWSPNAKRRYEGYNSTHATDYTQGNIDYTFTIHNYGGGSYWADLVLHIPKKYRTAGGYYKDYRSMGAEWLKGAAKDAVASELHNSFSREFNEMVKSVKVTHEYKRR